MDDSSLLKRYISENDEKAFGEIVARYYPLVHRVAYAKTGDYSLADDVATAVFILLASRARSIGPKTVLSGWLFRAAHLSASNALRAEQRRQKYEAKAAKMAENNRPEIDLAALAQVDDAVMKLSDRERNAVILRYLQELSIDETALSLGISPEAAKKRAQRGLQQLRRYCLGHDGVALNIAAISTLLAVKTAHGAPASIVTASLGRESYLTSHTQIHQIYQGAIRQMFFRKLKTMAAFIGAGAVLATNSFTVIHAQEGRQSDKKFSSASQGSLLTPPRVGNLHIKYNVTLDDPVSKSYCEKLIAAIKKEGTDEDKSNISYLELLINEFC